jgi:hypothetical protein
VVKAIGLAINVAALVVIYGLFGGGLALRAAWPCARTSVNIAAGTSITMRAN